jgi:DNA-binding MarR family transcriptional regulator
MKPSKALDVAATCERLGRLLVSDAHSAGLLPVQWEALRYLSRANRFSRTLAALTAYLGLTKGTVSQTVKALEARTLVRKKRSTSDRRSNHLELTGRGKRLLDSDPLLETVTAIEALPEATRDALAIGARELLSTRLTARGRQPFGICRDCVYFGRRHDDGKPHFCLLLKEPLSEADSGEICFEQVPA